jgi:hypothetical protein
MTDPEIDTEITEPSEPTPVDHDEAADIVEQDDALQKAGDGLDPGLERERDS